MPMAIRQPLKKGIKVWLKTIDQGLSLVARGLIKIYQWTLSPDEWIFSSVLKGKICHHTPHCSKYGMEVLERYGFFRGLWMITDRILACKPSLSMTYDPSHYSVVFFSSAEIGVPFLEILKNDPRFEVTGIVTQGDKPFGRGLQLKENIIKEKARAFFPDQSDFSSFIQTPETLRKNTEEGDVFYQWLKAKNPDFLVVIAYGNILTKRILEIPQFWAINIHGSLLPKYRGASPLQTVFLEKEKETWITIMKMDVWMDTGAIIDSLKIKMPFHRTTADLIETFKEVGPSFFADTLWNFGKGVAEAEPQDESQATYCKKIEKSDGEINPCEDTLEEIYAKYRAFSLRPKIRFTRKEKKVIVEALKLDEITFETHKKSPLFQGKTLNSSVLSISVKPEGKKAMDWKSFCNGYC